MNKNILIISNDRLFIKRNKITMDINKVIVNVKSSLVDVLKKIDATESTQTVFVVDDAGKLLGTITDGDIRRAFIKGLTFDNPLIDFVFKDFSYLEIDKKDFNKLKEYREAKIKAVPVLSENGEIIEIIDFTVIKSLLPIDAVIMAGGKGRRLKPLTDHIPKPLIKVGNKEIISYNFDRLYQYGIFNQNITVNYLGSQIEDFCVDYNDRINFKIFKEDQFLGTAGSLSLIDAFDNDTILLMNSDFLTNINYEAFFRSF